MSVPPHVIATSLAALGLHDPSVPVARLVGDSLLDDEVVAPQDVDRRLVFRNEFLTVEICVRYLPDRRQLTIEVTPDHRPELVLLQPGNDVQREIRDRSADLADVRPGLTSVVLRNLPDGSTQRTAWVVL